MVDVVHKTCEYEGCRTRPTYNIPTEKSGAWCIKHKKDNMADVTHKICEYDGCITRENFNVPPKTNAIFYASHKTKDMTNVKKITKSLKKSLNESVAAKIDQKCKYCDIEENSNFVCNECLQIQTKKEWMVVRHLRKNIETPFIHNSSSMLQGCCKRRPDAYFELLKHCIIVEIDENQHGSYEEVCECARINEIVNGIGGKSLILIRFNPDKIKNNKKEIKIALKDRLKCLVMILKRELIKDYDEFQVKLIQLYYNCHYEDYYHVKIEVITDIVCV